MILGIGALIANFACPSLFDQYTTGGVVNFRGLFLIPCGAAIVAAVLLFLLFHPPAKAASDGDSGAG